MDKITVATISMNSGPNKESNVAQAISLVKEAATIGAQWVQLPEMFSYMGPYENLHQVAEVDGGPLASQLANLAAKLGIVLFAGSVQEKPPEGSKVYNTSYVFGRNGEVIGKYRKIHLFNLDATGSSAAYKESDGYLPGDRVVAFDIDGFKVALGICYDIRFPGFFSAVEKSHGIPDVYSLPSAFTFTTGSAHWHLLLKARAVERQAYVIAANQVGSHGPGKESYGHSIIIDPWGDVVADTGSQVGIAVTQISRAFLHSVRQRLPALRNRVEGIS